MGTNVFDYAYDPIGNCGWAQNSANTNSYEANELNPYTQISNLQSTNQLAYDPDGNLTNDGVWVYGWNGENRLTTVGG